MEITNIKNNPSKPELASGFLGGLNDFQDETLIKENELTEAKNIVLNVDGISPRDGITNYGSEVGTKILGAIGYYKQDGTREFLRYCLGSNNKLQKYVAGVPTDIGTQTYNATADINLLQVDDKVFTFNGQDALTYYDGSTITAYSALTTPVGLSVTPTGTTGSTAYSYRISAFNSVGETLACAAVAISNGNATLNATNYNALAWTATAGATGYNVYGRIAGGLGETYLTTVYINSYADTAEKDPSLSLLPPAANTTTGVKGTMAEFGISRIFVAGDPDNPSRLYFSGTGDRITDFSFSSIGGGAIEVYKKDGAIIRGIKAFQGSIIIFKDNAIYKFFLNTDDGTQTLQEITRSFGGISHRGIKSVENDLIFPAKKDGRLAFYSLGNQENYASTVLRTNELSIKIEQHLKDVNPAKLQRSCAFYFENIYGCAVARDGSDTNNRVWCLDTRFGSWVYWEGINANIFMTYIDTDGTEKLYFGDENNGSMVEMFTGNKNDNGTEIDVRWSTKSFNGGRFDKYKKYYNPTFQFKDVTQSGVIDGYIYTDGAILDSQFSVNQQTTGGTGFGAYLFGLDLFGAGAGETAVSANSSDMVQEVYTRPIARAIKYVFVAGVNDVDFKFLSLSHNYKILENKRLPSTSRSYPS